jgi:hypothetical protein
MPELVTPRLRCSPLQLDDWPFSQLTARPQVMLYVADPRPVADIRDAFDSRLPRGRRGAHWLCLVVRDRYTHAPWASPAISITLPTALKRVFCSLPGRRAKVTAMSLCARCAITLLHRRHPAADGNRHRGQPGVKNLLQRLVFIRKASCANATGSTVAGTTIGCLACCAAITTSLGHLANRARRAFPLHCRPTTEEAINVPNDTAAKPAGP